MRVIAVANQKGGTGKTTTAWAIITGAAARGRRVLAVDADPQGSLTYIMGADANRPGVFDWMKGKPPAVQHTTQGDIIPGSLSLATIDRSTNSRQLQRAVAQLKNYDLVVIDSSPGLGALMMNTLAAATDVLIPLQADILSLQGLYQLNQSIEQVRAALNPSLGVCGVVLTRFSSRSIVSRDMAEAIGKRCADLRLPYIDTPIREGVAVKEAQLLHQSIYEYSPRSNPVRDYTALLDAIKI